MTATKNPITAAKTPITAANNTITAAKNAITATIIFDSSFLPTRPGPPWPPSPAQSPKGK